MIFRHTIKVLTISFLLLCLVSGLCACGKPINEIEHVPASAVSALQDAQRVNSKDVKTIIFNRVSKDGAAQLDIKEQEAIDHYMKKIGELRLTEVTYHSSNDDSLSVAIYATEDTHRLKAEGDYLVFGRDHVVCDNIDTLKNAVDADIRKNQSHQNSAK